MAQQSLIEKAELRRLKQENAELRSQVIKDLARIEEKVNSIKLLLERSAA
ncbi:MAG: hypothetical protein JRN26_05490 [Nitrososphaerota archaeon]|jgi:hypothetical protein|nr:hypothetical protein [Nitrososphaerota archaeon]MDG6927178.1 hypothetical protein [Nitrososphaerota archaeon]MDG6930834.1 hypothetical protein [Nitrososphaerota archaeon]MDG6932278.1 hypothetical protein [Nitrososphaerota archaeon]MDG6936317.1 hypothetical protein [Nitrososphaerota archaeon]